MRCMMREADIVMMHWWDHPLLYALISEPLPACRMVAWAHKNISYSLPEITYPDLFLDTSPIQGHVQHIWSTGDMERFFNIKPAPHEGFNVGYCGTVDYKKLHRDFIPICKKIADVVPDVHFTVVGEMKLPDYKDELQMGGLFTFIGKVDDVAPYLAEMNVFGYPLRPDHSGTCEQVLGEALAAGVVPVVMNNSAERLIIEDGRNGYIGIDEKDYVKAIQFLYSNPKIRKSMSKHARQDAKELYSIKKMVKQWDDVFQEMMKQPKRLREKL